MLPLLLLFAVFLLPGTAFAQAAGTTSGSPIIPPGVWGTIIATLISLALTMHVGDKIVSGIKSLLGKSQGATIVTNHTANDMLQAFIAAGGTVLTQVLTGDKLDGLLKLIAAGGNGSSIVSYLSANFGSALVDDLLATVGPLAAQEAQILFGGMAGVHSAAMKALAQAAPAVATSQAAAKLSAAQVGAGLAALSQPAGAR